MLRTLTSALVLLLLLPAAASATQVPYAGPHAVTLKAADGALVHGWHHPGAGPLILLFHQAAGSAAEYDDIGLRLYAMGYSVLAIDARAGGDMFGRPNTTAQAFKDVGRDWIQALPDLEAALAWSKGQRDGQRVVLWGSSYSAALAFLLAAKHPDRVAAVLAFSPGEYLKTQKGAVARAVVHTKSPIFLMTPSKEAKTVAPILEALKGKRASVHVLDSAVHGSSALIAKRCKGAAKNWKPVLAFLKRYAPVQLTAPKP